MSTPAAATSRNVWRRNPQMRGPRGSVLCPCHAHRASPLLHARVHAVSMEVPPPAAHDSALMTRATISSLLAIWLRRGRVLAHEQSILVAHYDVLEADTGEIVLGPVQVWGQIVPQHEVLRLQVLWPHGKKSVWAFKEFHTPQLFGLHQQLARTACTSACGRVMRAHRGARSSGYTSGLIRMTQS